MSINNAERLERRFFLPWQFWIATGFVLLMSGWVLIRSIHRPYDTVPDQDLLWLSEALRLYRGAQTTYIDHPGALWTLMNLANVDILQKIGGIHYTIGDGISIVDASRLIGVSRAENSLFCAATLISLWPIARWLGANKNQTMLWIIILSCSSGYFWSLVQIRHEMASILFASLFLLLSKYASKKSAKSSRWRKLAIWAAAIASLISSMYCKIQIMFAFPIILCALLSDSPTVKDRHFRHQLFFGFRQLSRIETITFFTSLLITAGIIGRYTREQGYAFDIRSVAFWLALNTFLSLWGLGSIGESTDSNKGNKYNNLRVARNSFILGLPALIELSFAAAIFRGGWTAGWSGTVFRAPTELLGGRGLYYSGGNEAVKNGLSLNSVLNSLSLRLEETYFLPSLVTILLFGVIALIALTLLRNTSNINLSGEAALRHSSQAHYLNLLIAMAATGLTVIANSARDQNFYAIYISIPTLLIACILSSQRKLQTVNPAIKFIALVLCASAITRAALNLSDLSRFTTFDHHSTLCYGQQMDIEMRHTSVGQCPNFEDEMKI